MINIGDFQLTDIRLGDTNPSSAYLGDILVYPSAPPSPYYSEYLTFIVQEAGTFKFSGSTRENRLQYSLDSGATWVLLGWLDDTPTVQSGASIMWKASNLTISQRRPNYGIGSFISSGRFEVRGNIMSLLYGDNFIGQTSLTGKLYAFRSLFFNSKTTNAENLILPATTLEQECYENMFNNCTSLTSAPELPATTLAYQCYYYMFQGCTSLTKAPSVIPAAGWNACDGMFLNCTSLTTAPELPATTIYAGCYASMFGECTSLVNVQSELPATTLATDCYYSMFAGCTSLTTAPELPATTLATDCYYSMFAGCTSLVNAQSVLPATALSMQCYVDMFGGCTSLETAPELPATTMDYLCYLYMFYGCTSLTTAPELPATTLDDGCYDGMFYGCSSLNYIKCLATTNLDSTKDWVDGVASSGTFVKASSATWPTGSNGIPDNWTVQNA